MDTNDVLSIDLTVDGGDWGKLIIMIDSTDVAYYNARWYDSE